jgi:hypothetical protein
MQKLHSKRDDDWRLIMSLSGKHALITGALAAFGEELKNQTELKEALTTLIRLSQMIVPAGMELHYRRLIALSCALQKT